MAVTLEKPAQCALLPEFYYPNFQCRTSLATVNTHYYRWPMKKICKGLAMNISETPLMLHDEQTTLLCCLQCSYTKVFKLVATKAIQ